MGLLEETVARIAPPNAMRMARTAQALRETMGAETGLGALSELLLKYTAISDEDTPKRPTKATIICCADHGVAEMKVSAYPPETTVEMTRNYLVAKGSVANALSNFACASLDVVDLGISAKTDDLPGLIHRKIAFGTKNCAVGPAMTRGQAVQAIETGIALAKSRIQRGVRCFLPGEMGIANTTSSACIVAALCHLTPEEATGRGTNISDARLKVKIDVVRQALAVNAPNPTDGLDVLAKVGGFELGCITGLILGAAAHHAFVALDGFNTGAAALIAQAICPLTPHYLMCSHLAAEPAHKAILDKLGLTPYMDMRFRLGEATGSSIAVNLLDATVAVRDALTATAAVPAFRTVTPTKNMMGATLAKKSFVACNAVDARTMDDAKEMADALAWLWEQATQVPSPDATAADACRLRIDNLAKPIYSLGHLEEIGVRLAGVTQTARPSLATGRALLSFAHGTLPATKARLTAAMAAHAGARVTLAKVDPAMTPRDALKFGATLASELAVDAPILAIAFAGDEDDVPYEKCTAIPGNENTALPFAQRFATDTTCADSTSMNATQEDATCAEIEARTLLDAINACPRTQRAKACAFLGALYGAAISHALVVLDDEATTHLARCAVAVTPALSPYLLQTQPDLLHLHMTVQGGAIACLGIKIIDAALHMINDMKTFAESGVSVANDGPGAGKQQE